MIAAYTAAVAAIALASRLQHLHSTPRSTPRSTPIFLKHVKCDSFELKALAGVWSLTMDLDDGLQKLACNLDASGTLTTEREGLSRIADAKDRWKAAADAESGSMNMRVSIGPWMLRGNGMRTNGLRCKSVTGSVLEGGDDPVCVGSFAMTLRVPVADAEELSELERSRTAKLDARPAPPPRFRRGYYIGEKWRLLVAFDDTEAPSIFTVRLREDGKFVSYSAGDESNSDGSESSNYDGAAARPQQLGGSWGVWDSTLRRDAKRQRPTNATLGTDFYMRVEREQCTSTLRGLANLPVHESFSLWGKPTLGSGMLAQLSARTEEGAPTNLVTGYCYFGTSVDREWFTCGRFSLMRDDEEDSGAEPAASDAE